MHPAPSGEGDHGPQRLASARGTGEGAHVKLDASLPLPVVVEDTGPETELQLEGRTVRWQ